MAKLEIPERVLAHDFNKLIHDFLSSFTVERHAPGLGVDEKQLFCNRCQAPLHALNTRVSLHDARFGDDCAGDGETIAVSLPYCKNCDELPTIGGCIHV